MKKTVFFIDGFNLYHAIAKPKYNKYKWLNFYKFANHFVNKFETVQAVYYFTALAHWNNEKVKNHKKFIKAQESVNVKTIFGQFKKRTKKCRICHQIYETYEEKQTDVNIAISMFRSAMADEFDKAFIVSGDSDLIPSIKAIKELFPNKEIGVLIPINGRAFELKKTCDFHIQMKESHLKENQFPDKIILKDNSYITRPQKWT